MQTINKIMVAVDFSDDSINAANYAAKLAVGVDATLLLADIIVGSCAQKMFRRSPIPLLSLRGEQTQG